MIQVFETAIAETQMIADRAEAHGNERAKAKAVRARHAVAMTQARLAGMPEELQRSIATALQKRQGGYLHLSPDERVWTDVPAAYARGERYDDAVLPYKSLL